MSANIVPQGHFTFLDIDHIIYGPGSSKQLEDEIKRLNVSKALIVTGQSLATKTNVVKTVETLLGQAHVGTFTNIKQHAPIQDIKFGVQLLREKNVDIIISIGGGSPIDGLFLVLIFLICYSIKGDDKVLC